MTKTTIPNFIQAKTPSELVESMLSNSLKANADIKYYSITYDGKNWIAWFNQDVDLVGLLAKVNTKTKKVK